MIRLRRLRSTESLRTLVREHHIAVSKLIYPIFLQPGTNQKVVINAMPGIFSYSQDRILEEINEAMELGIRSFLVFAKPFAKDEYASEAIDPHGVFQQGILHIKKNIPDAFLIVDICVCSYTDHGHCGILKGDQVDNDLSLPVLQQMALTLVQAGADMVAPSAMMDHQVLHIREFLDKHGFSATPIMGYSAKFASAFYGPFREVADSAPQFGDRKSYQMDPANAAEALREAQQDATEGADILMVKPAMSYLDIVYSIKSAINLPLAVYNVSGEYSMIKAATQIGWIDEQKVVLELMLSFFRAGADMVITYFAKDVATYLKDSDHGKE